MADVAGLVSEVAPDQGEVVPGEVFADEIVSNVGEAEIVVPVDPAEPIELSQGSAGALMVELPEELAVGEAEVAPDGSVVFRDVGGGADAVVQSLDDGSVRIQTVTADAAAPHEFTYSFGEGVVPLLNGDGSVSLVNEVDGYAAFTVGVIDQAWAFDAEGNEVPTEFRVEGDALIQVVEPELDAAYPIVADPKITRTWWNTTVYSNKRETAAIAAASSAVALAALLVPDVTLSKIIAGESIVSSAYVSWMINTGSCLKFVYYGHLANVWQPYGGSEAGRYCR